MTITLTQARKLLSAAELEVFVTGRGEPLRALTATQLRAKVRRSRTLRDKFQDLLQRQRLASRDRAGSKLGSHAPDNARTADKAQVFSEALGRLEARLAQLDAAVKRAARKTAQAGSRDAMRRHQDAQALAASARQGERSRKAPARTPRAGAAIPTAGSERARAARQALQFDAAGRQRVQAHLASRGRRQQGKRDGQG